MANFYADRTKTQEEILALGRQHTALNGCIYYGTDGGVFVGKADGSLMQCFKGKFPELMAGNLASWAERSSVLVEDEWDAVQVRTTAGSLSVNTAEGAHFISVKSKGKFTLNAIKASGENLLIASQVISGTTIPYMLVPACAFGTFGTADENNGILVTKNNGTKRTPSMRFKAFASGVPTSASDGIACPYRDVEGYRFYLPASMGYIWASDIDTSTDCVHLAWSKGYDEYHAVSAFSTLSFASVINKFTQIGGAYFMLAVSKGGREVYDEFKYDATKFHWVKRCGLDTSAWTNTPIYNEDAEVVGYEHSKTIDAMAADGLARDLDGLLDFEVNGKVVSFTDENATTTASVVYELNTETSGDVTMANAYQPNDMGCEYLDGMQGEAIVITSYFQGIPDELAALPSKVQRLREQLEQAEAELAARAEGLAENFDALISGKMIATINAGSRKYRDSAEQLYGIGTQKIAYSIGTAGTITISWKVLAISFSLDIAVSADDTLITLCGKIRAALAESLAMSGITEQVVELAADGILVTIDSSEERDINTFAVSGATLTEVSEKPAEPDFIGQWYNNTQKGKAWRGKKAAANGWAEIY